MPPGAPGAMLGSTAAKSQEEQLGAADVLFQPARHRALLGSRYEDPASLGQVGVGGGRLCQPSRNRDTNWPLTLLA